MFCDDVLESYCINKIWFCNIKLIWEFVCVNKHTGGNTD